MQQTEACDSESLISLIDNDLDEPHPLGKNLNLILDSTFTDHFEEISNKNLLKLKLSDFRKKFYPQVSEDLWNNWHWQIKNSITEYDNLKKFFDDSDKVENLAAFDALIEKKLPFRITPYYAALAYASLSIRKTVIPSLSELIVSKGESIDPLNEDHDMSGDCIVHRYPDRVLFLATGFCSVNCRYCTRSRIVSGRKLKKNQLDTWNSAFEYIRNNRQIRDVIISGGDPLTLNDNTLEYIISNLRKIEHIEIIRIGTKVPVVLPMRINRNLLKMLKKYHPIYFSIHFTHPDEITEEVKQACNLLADNGFPLGSQTVLLNEVNDDPFVMRRLMQKLLTIRVKPYYIYQCDPIMGSSHFRTPVSKGIEIIENLRGWTSGYAIPHFVIDAPGGGGKIPLIPDYTLPSSNENVVKLRNYENKTFSYYNPY